MSVNQLTNVFGGFAPFPNTIATALLAYQSEAIGFGFGIKFQYSKRLIGAMTNEEFNALTPITIGNIVEAHNTELINRMADEMPKWLEIQHNFIEASVAIELAKASRTPSAMTEIFTAFVTATAALGDEITFENFADKWNAFFGGRQIFTPPPSEVTPDPEEPIPPTPHVEGDIHTPEEHVADADAAAILADQALFKILKITWLDPARGTNQTYTTPELNHGQHHTHKTFIQQGMQNNSLTLLTDTGQTFGGGTNVVFAYESKIASSYLH